MKAEIADFPDLVTAVTALMKPYTGTWALCGGWAIDSWLGRVTRPHGDLDIAVFLDEQRLFRDQLADWRLVAHETNDADHHDPWDGHELRPAAHLHAASDQGPTRELLVNERELGEGIWTLRKQNGARDALPLARFALPGPLGLPTMAPEALMFYKLSGETRERDGYDIAHLWGLVDEPAKDWLATAPALNYRRTPIRSLPTPPRAPDLP